MKKVNPNLCQAQNVRFSCNCPPRCVCGSKQTRDWYHEACQEEQFINSNGDIFCQNAYYQKGCEEFFIQHARFLCREAAQKQAAQNNKDKTYMQFRSAAEFLMAIAQAMQSAKFTLKDQELMEFGTTLNQNVVKKWLR